MRLRTWPLPLVVPGLLALRAAAGATPLDVCPDCVVWRIEGAQARGLLDCRPAVTGLRLLVEGPEAASAAAALAAAGADAGIQVPPGATLVADPLPSWLVVQALDHDEPAALAFRLKALTSDLRARRDGIRIGLEAPAALLDRLSRDEMTAYLDFFMAPSGTDAPLALPEVWRRSREGAASLDAVARASAGGTTVVLDSPATDEVRLAWAALASAVGPEAVAAGAPSARCAAGARDVPCRVRSFRDRETDGLLLWVDADEAVDRVTGPRSATAVIALAGPPIAAVPSADAVTVDPASRSFLLRLAPAAGEEQARFQEDVEVAAERSLTAPEVLARHRAAEQSRRRRVPRLIASGDTTIGFMLPGLSAPATVTALTVLYEDGPRREVEHRDLRWNGTPVPLGGGRIPRLPIVEPAAAEPPLAIRLDEAYSYRLQARETVEGRPAYVLAFEPRAAGGARGRAWIDAADFGLSRLETVRAGLPGPIVSSEQHDSFTRVQVAGRPAWLLSRSDIHQAYEGPGHRTPIDRLVRFDRIEPNPADFQSRRAAAHAGDGVLMRETAEGFGWLAADPRGGERRPAGKSDSVRTLALGVTLDPAIDGPLPFGGVGYLDLDLFGTGAQLNAFLGVGFVQAAFTAPRLGRSGWQAHGALLAVLVRYNDRSFHQGVENYGETLRQRPSRATLGLSRALSARTRVRVSYELEHNALGRSDLTAPDFITPVRVFAHGVRLELEARHGAWTAQVFGSAARRDSWEPWGRQDAPEPLRRSYQRFGASLARSLVATPRLTGRLEASWMAGRDLDRFSRYAVDSFLNRLRGYPTGSLRYDRGLLLRGQAGARLGTGVRADLFLDAGFLRDPGYGDGLRAFPGLGLGLQAALPRGVLLVAEGGYAFAGRDREGRKGTRSLQVTAVKTF